MRERKRERKKRGRKECGSGFSTSIDPCLSQRFFSVCFSAVTTNVGRLLSVLLLACLRASLCLPQPVVCSAFPHLCFSRQSMPFPLFPTINVLSDPTTIVS